MRDDCEAQVSGAKRPNSVDTVAATRVEAIASVFDALGAGLRVLACRLIGPLSKVVQFFDRPRLRPNTHHHALSS